MRFSYKMRGTCAKVLSFDIKDAVISNVSITGGCSGNSKGISALVEGMNAENIIERCRGIKCGFKHTSCPDQLAKAVEAAINKEKEIPEK